MKTLVFKNHIIELLKDKNSYELRPYYYNGNGDFEAMGDVILDKTEISKLIVGLQELLHGKN